MTVSTDLAIETHGLRKEYKVDQQCTVIAFGRKARSLEEAFVRLMEGESHGR